MITSTQSYQKQTVEAGYSPSSNQFDLNNLSLIQSSISQIDMISSVSLNHMDKLNQIKRLD